MLTILQGDALAKLRELPDESVHCCVTSPPYWGLRDYGTAQWEGGGGDCDHKKVNDPNAGTRGSGLEGGKESNGHQQEGFKHTCGKCGAKRIDSQLGLEKTPEEYVARMVEIFREVRRVLREDGTLWLNLGDTYASTAPGTMGDPLRQEGILAGVSDRRANGSKKFRPDTPTGLKPKDLVGVPWRVAFALQADGWWLRQDIIWAKPNPMPESVTDRCTKAHEYMFLLTKSARYFYDAEAIKEPMNRGDAGSFFNTGKTADHQLGRSSDLPRKQRKPAGWDTGEGAHGTIHRNGRAQEVEYTEEIATSRNKRSVWTVATAPYPEAHFATYPPDLIKPCILAGTSAKGCCAKCGAPWERVVEREQTKEGESYGSRMERWGDEFTPAHQGGRSFQVPIRYNLSQSDSKTTGWQPACECKAWQSEKMTAREINSCTVLDPFAGSGTTGAVALELGRKAILIELNPKYIEMIEQRCNITPGLALA